MFSSTSKNSSKVANTAFSEFFRNSSSGEKKKVFAHVIEISTNEQNRIIQEANAKQRKACA